jgi:hypothetical protein
MPPKFKPLELITELHQALITNYGPANVVNYYTHPDKLNLSMHYGPRDSFHTPYMKITPKSDQFQIHLSLPAADEPVEGNTMAANRVGLHNRSIGPTLDALAEVLRRHNIDGKLQLVKNSHQITINGKTILLVWAIKPNHGSHAIGKKTLKETMDGLISKIPVEVHHTLTD